MDTNLKREIIVDNVENPFHRGIKDKENFIKANTHNESCIDNIDLYVKIQDNKIIDAYFEGEACAITTSATSIMLKKIIGLTKEEARSLMKEYYQMIEEEAYNSDKLGELNVYSDIAKQPSRKKCATLPFQTLEKTLKISEIEIDD
ncbi:MAG: Fe-S cluster assembly sulfur transfer protein SufU [Bacilli bacterium]